MVFRRITAVVSALLPLLLLSAIGSGSAATQKQKPIPYSETQAGMNETAAKNFAKADAEMNRVYKKLLSSLDSKAQSKLRESQRFWLKFRDAEAEFRSTDSVGGSIYPMVYAGNRTNITSQRIKDLNDAYKNYHTEGTM